MKIDEVLVKALTSYDKSRERSKQKEIGVSQIGGCRRAVWLQLQGTPKENQTLKLPALMGTAIHKMIEEALIAENQNNWTDYWLEQEFEYDGIKGHVDLYIPEIGAVVDWKTTKMRNLDYFPSEKQRWQVQLYAWLIQQTGKGNPQTVTLVAIPRDGDERQIKVHTEEYNPEIAELGVKWLREVQDMTTPPAPERYAAQFCKFYCSYFGESCGGKGKEVPQEVITDSVTISAAKRYIEINKTISELESEKDSVKAQLENVTGVTPSGIKISWATINGRKSIDEEAVEKALGEVPYKYGEPSMRLTVKE